MSHCEVLTLLSSQLLVCWSEGCGIGGVREPIQPGIIPIPAGESREAPGSLIPSPAGFTKLGSKGFTHQSRFTPTPDFHKSLTQAS